MTIKRYIAPAAAALALGLVMSVTGCASAGNKDVAYSTQEKPSKFLGIFGGEDAAAKQAAANEQMGIGVNAYLWRASLDTISFMPLNSADPWGGVIISDWYANPQQPAERFKTTIYILDSRLRADALNVSVYKQVNQGGQWIDAEVSQQTQLDIENAILTRARELRLSDVKN